MIVARHEVPGTVPPQKNRPVDPLLMFLADVPNPALDAC
jgi:hypothetical protein